MRYVRPFATISLDDVPEVGGKNASLGEMVHALALLGVPVPDGFAVTAAGYRLFVAANGLDRAIHRLEGLDIDDIADLKRRGEQVRAAFLSAHMPAELAEDIADAYTRLGERPAVAVRSSATAEDLPEASFAGQQETWLNVRGVESVVATVQRCFASLFTDRAISYRQQRGYDHGAVALSVGVQHMVRSDLAGSGVMFTLDTETGFRDVVLINAAWGLGETVVQGQVVPDEYVVFKPTLKNGFRPLLRRTIGSKEIALVYDEGGGRGVRTRAVPPEERARPVLSDDEALELARLACIVEDHYSAKAGHLVPLDLEWGKDGETGTLYILQARPETVQARHAVTLEQHRLNGQGEVLLTGRAVGDRIASGRARVLASPDDLGAFRDGEVLVAERTDPDWEPVMRRAAAIVTARGGRTCHAAIVARELGVPAVVGAEGATALPDGRLVTVCCAEGEVGRVYDGAIPFEITSLDPTTLERPRTHVMMNVGNPSEAFKLAAMPCDGVGLAREEFIVTSAIGIHPLALLDFDALAPGLKAEIGRKTEGWADKSAFFVRRLAEGIGTIAAAFWPRPVIVRLSDFKTNEYANLLGGTAYEPVEPNPMIGWRGASRYHDPRYREAFALECRALLAVREDMGLRNVKLMVPFCRTVDEGRRVIAALADNGLVQGEHDLEVYVMCEIPSNALLAEQFGAVFNGFSIGSNDLTQLTLGVDRDSERLAGLFDERDEAVKALIGLAIDGAHAAGRPIGICGQAPSDFPEFAAWLVQRGIDSLSLNPDAVLETTRRVLAVEKKAAAARQPRAARAAR